MTITRFIIIDDDSLNNKLCRYLISKVAAPGTDIVEFTSAGKALQFISDSYTQDSPCNTVLFLDINMPDTNGWEFLAFYDMLPDTIQEQIEIYVLSSSVDGRDKDRAKQNRHVSDFIEKPLREQVIISIMNKVQPAN